MGLASLRFASLDTASRARLASFHLKRNLLRTRTVNCATWQRERTSAVKRWSIDSIVQIIMTREHDHRRRVYVEEYDIPATSGSTYVRTKCRFCFV